jgi:curved DNA-binding protein CbpA
MALAFLLGAFALWWLWPRAAKRPSPVDAARARLGLGPGADAAQIEHAFRARLLHTHPDKGGSTQETQALTEARDLLLASLRQTRHQQKS